MALCRRLRGGDDTAFLGADLFSTLFLGTDGIAFFTSA